MCLQKRPIEWEDVVRRSGTDDHCSFVDLCGTSKRRSGFAYHRVKRGTERNLKARTGYGSAELDVVWKQVRPHLEHLRPKIGHDMTKSYFLCVYIMIHIGVRIQSVNLISTPSTGALSVTTYYDRVRPIQKVIAERIDQIRPENRYLPNNHVFHFPKWVTGIVDCGAFCRLAGSQANSSCACSTCPNQHAWSFKDDEEAVLRKVQDEYLEGASCYFLFRRNCIRFLSPPGKCLDLVFHH